MAISICGLQDNRTLKLLSFNECKLEGKGAKSFLPIMKKNGLMVRFARNPMIIFTFQTIKPVYTDGTLEVNLFLAIEQGDYYSVVTLMLDGANPTVQNDTDGKSAIHIAAIKGDQAILEIILDHPKADMNVKDDNEMTPILCAMEEGKTKIVQYLLDRGADFRIPNIKKKTLLHFCAEKGNKMLVKYLIEKLGDDLSLCTADQETVLHFAALGQHLETIKYLIERETMERKALVKSEQLQDIDPTAFVNWQDVRGDSALHLVFSNLKVDLECAKVLVALGGADPSLENNSHQSALAKATDQQKSILLTEARKFKK
jgi:ankyrin repeat protein